MKPVFEGSPFSWEISEDTLILKGEGDLTYPLDGDGRLCIPWYYLDFHFVRFEGNITSIGDETFHTSDLVTVDIPDSVVSIGALAFCECRSLENVNFGKGLRTIGNYAFMDCDRLGSIALGPDVTDIGYNAFENCTGLMTFTPSPRLQSLGDYAFLNCRCLRSVILPRTVESIGVNPFAECIVMGRIIIEEGCPNYMSEMDVIYTSDRSEIVAYPAFKTGPFSIPGTIRKIRKSAFRGSVISRVTIPGSTMVLDNESFRNCIRLSSVVMEESQLPLDIGGECFMDCPLLETVSLRGNTVGFGPGSFQGCSALKELIIPENIVSIPQNCFKDCGSLASVALPMNLETIEESAFSNCSRLNNMEFPANLSVVGPGAFKDCVSLETLHLPEELVDVGEGAFYGCTSLSEVTRPMEYGDEDEYFENTDIIRYTDS